MIVVTGATGQLGRQVVNFLKERVPLAQIAVSVRQPEKAADLAADGIEVRAADFGNRASVVRAFTGADKVLMISSNSRDAVSEHCNAVEAAVEAGVRHLVYTSGIQAEGTFVASVHKRTEDAIRASGLTYTFLRNNLYAEVLVREVLRAANAGALNAPVGTGKVTTVTRGDCALAAAAVLASPGHDDKTYDITGTESIGWGDLAAIASEITGRLISHQSTSTDEVNPVMQDYYQGIARGGYDVKSSAVAELTGRHATSATAFIKQAAREALAK